jgi:hypothetical protein
VKEGGLLPTACGVVTGKEEPQVASFFFLGHDPLLFISCFAYLLANGISSID